MSGGVDFRGTLDHGSHSQISLRPFLRPSSLWHGDPRDGWHIAAGETDYLSAAIVPQTTDGINDFGSFTVDGTTYDFNNMTYGTPQVSLG